MFCLSMFELIKMIMRKKATSLISRSSVLIKMVKWKEEERELWSASNRFSIAVNSDAYRHGMQSDFGEQYLSL